MESSISSFCKTLASLCNHIESSTKALSDSIQRRPIPLDSAASAFLQSLDRRMSSAGADLNLLDSMANGTVSLEELLGHFNELYRSNQNHLAHIEDAMISFGYVPEVELDEEEEELANPGSKGLEEELLYPSSLF